MQVQEENEWGVIALDADPLGVEFTSESLRTVVRSTEGQHCIGDGRSARAGRQGRRTVAGSIEGELQPNGFWPLMARYALGDPVNTTGSGPYVHTLLGSDTLPTGLTIEKGFRQRTGALRRFRYAGCRVDEFFLRVAPGAVSGRVTLLGKIEDTPSGAPAAASYQLDNSPYVYTNAGLRLAIDSGLQAVGFVQTIEMTVANRMNPDKHSTDGAYRDAIPAGGRSITGTMHAMFTSEAWAAYQNWLVDAPVQIGLDLARTVNGVTYGFNVLLPSVRLMDVPTPQFTGKGAVGMDLKYEADFDGSIGSDIAMTITNTDSTLTA